MIVNIDKDFNFFHFKENNLIFFNDQTFITKDIKLTDYFQQTLRFDNKVFYVINKNKFEMSENKYNFINDKTKIFIPNVLLSFSNFFIDTFGIIVETLKNINNPFFIIDMDFDQQVSEYMGGLDFEKQNNQFEEMFGYHVAFLKDFLEKNNLEYVFLTNNYSIALNNFYIINSITNSDRKFKEIYNASTIYNQEKTFSPYKKVYLIRNMHKNIKNITENSNRFKQRIINENILVNYLKGLGFECIVPEDYFRSIEDQMLYFKEVKTIFSVTSSSLLNSLFMQPGGNVIELVSPMIEDKELNYYRLHSGQYLHMSYAQSHNYFGLPNLIDGDKIINQLKNNKAILEILGK